MYLLSDQSYNLNSQMPIVLIRTCGFCLWYCLYQTNHKIILTTDRRHCQKWMFRRLCISVGRSCFIFTKWKPLSYFNEPIATRNITGLGIHKVKHMCKAILHLQRLFSVYFMFKQHHEPMAHTMAYCRYLIILQLGLVHVQ